MVFCSAPINPAWPACLWSWHWLPETLEGWCELLTPVLPKWHWHSKVACLPDGRGTWMEKILAKIAGGPHLTWFLPPNNMIRSLLGRIAYTYPITLFHINEDILESQYSLLNTSWIKFIKRFSFFLSFCLLPIFCFWHQSGAAGQDKHVNPSCNQCNCVGWGSWNWYTLASIAQQHFAGTSW